MGSNQVREGKMRGSIVLLLMAALVSPVAASLNYTDATGENFTGAGGGILDIVSAEVSNTATDITFKINLAGDPVATDWGKYMVGIDSAPGGDTAGNGWARPISMSSGMDYWIGSWVDGGNGIEVWNYSGSWANGNPLPRSITKDSSSVSLTTTLASLGLTPTSSFTFDIYTSGGGAGDGAVDALGNDNQTIADWGNSYNSGSNVEAATLPEPAALGLLTLAGASLLRRRRAC